MMLRVWVPGTTDKGHSLGCRRQTNTWLLATKEEYTKSSSEVMNARKQDGSMFSHVLPLECADTEPSVSNFFACHMRNERGAEKCFRVSDWTPAGQLSNHKWHFCHERLGQQ